MRAAREFSLGAEFVPKFEFQNHGELFPPIDDRGFADHCRYALALLLKKRVDLEPSLASLLRED